MKENEESGERTEAHRGCVRVFVGAREVFTWSEEDGSKSQTQKVVLQAGAFKV